MSFTARNIVNFWKYVLKGDACWEWTGFIGRGGYGNFAIGGRPQRAHRVSWELHNGPIPESMHVLHTCDNRGCVNPAHLFLGTNADNVADKVRKNRQHRPRHVVTNSVLSTEQVLEIKALLNEGVSQQLIARKFGISDRTVSGINVGHRWRHVAEAQDVRATA